MFKQKHIFARNKPLINIYNVVDNQGKEIEVREDAEQLVKYHEIVEALVAAGYYRAQLQGLSAFDKIVGGMTWCIEICDIDVDVNLLFEEDLTIGKKMYCALTEKIVAVLPKIQCPYIIEPHQIQGLDFINIYPLILWLIKYSDEFRGAKEEELRKFAVMQYDKDYIFESDRPKIGDEFKFLNNLYKIQNMYKPCRVRKRKGAVPTSELEQVTATLSEYDQRMLLHSSSNGEENDEGLEFLNDYEKALADPSKITTKAETFGNNEDISALELSERKMHYVILQSELSGDVSLMLEESEKNRYKEEMNKLSNVLETTEKSLKELKGVHSERLINLKNELSSKLEKFHSMNKTICAYKDTDSLSMKDLKAFYKTLKELKKERDELLLLIRHKKEEKSNLEDLLSSLTDPNNRVVPVPPTAEEVEEFDRKKSKIVQYIGDVRLELARVNRQVLGLAVAVDEVPGQAELLQYEKRFLELYNQVGAKHRETKQYFTFYNTLVEVKLYTSKELSLLNSILENYSEAMSSARKREQLMSQLESIVEWVQGAVDKVDRKHALEKQRRAGLAAQLAQLLDVRRQYAAVLRALHDERRKLAASHQPR